MQFLFSDYTIKSVKRIKNKRGQLLSMVSLIPLAACGGGSPAPSTPAVPLGPDYTENPTGTFTGRDNADLTLAQGSATTDLSVNSKDGNDTITTGSGHDIINGAGGNDTIDAGSGNNTINGGAGSDTITSGDGNDTINAGEGNNIISAGGGDNIITTGGGDNIITTGGGDDSITTESGDDTVTVSGGTNSITTGAGNDNIIGSTGIDTITSSDGNDIIRANLGADIINAGAGDDIIVIVGTTGADEYAETSITNPGGSGLDVSSVLTLAELNDHASSDAEAGETIDGGAGNDTIMIYGTVDLTGITIVNVANIQVNSTLTLTATQFAEFTNISGDGSTILNIVNDTGSDPLVIDLANTNLADIDTLNTTGNIEIIVSSVDDLAGIANLVTDSKVTLVLADDGTGTNSINLSGLAAVIDSVDAIEVGPIVTLVIDDVTSITDMTVSELGGGGTIVVSDVAATSPTLLSGVIVDEDVTVEDPSGAVVVTEDFGGVLIADIEPSDVGVLPEISISDITANEAEELATFTVSLNARFYETVTVDYTAPDGTTGTLTFAADETTQTFTTAWVDDNTDEGDEVVTATLSNAVNATVSDATGALTIVDDDAAPAISVTDLTVNEADGTAGFTVSLDAASGKEITVDYSLNDGTLITLTFAAGEASKTVTAASWTDDSTDEAVGDTAQTLVISNPVNAALGTSSATLTIADDDAVPTISIDDISTNEVDAIDTFTVTLSAASGKDVTVDYTAPDGTTGTLAFAVGETTQTFTSGWADDSTDEADETQTATLSNPNNATLLDDTGILTIMDDDLPALSIANMSVNESAETATFIVSIDQAPIADVTVDYVAPDGTSGTLTFTAGSTTDQTFTTTWTDDSIDEVNEAVSATLSNPANAEILDGIGTLTILDDDGAPTLTLSDVSVDEASELATFTVSLLPASSFDVTVDYTAPDGTTGTLTFAAGETIQTFTTAWTDDSIDEADEVVAATLSNPSNATIADASGNLTITDDDAAPTISIDDISANEIDQTDTFTVSLSAASGKEITVNYTAPDGSTGTLTFAAGETTQTFSTTWIDDSVTEHDQVLAATLVNPINASFAPQAEIELSSLYGSNGFVINGVDYKDFSGRSVSNAGDVNGDGYDDFIIGASGVDTNGISSGASYVVYGDPSVDGGDGIIDLSTLDGSNGFVINGVDYKDYSGTSVSSAGDVNGDGFNDLIIGARLADGGGIYSGASYVVYGGPSVDGGDGIIDLSALDGSNGFVINGIAESDHSGTSVSNAGDVNGDGYDDLIVGADYVDTNGINSGASYVVYGGPGVDGGDGVIDLSALDGSNGFVINGIAEGDNSGTSVSNAGDVNGDGYDDLIVGAPFVDSNGNSSGASYVVYGGLSIDGGDGIIDLSTLDGSNGFVINGIAESDLTGISVSNAGDVNGDGYDDLIVGAKYVDAGGINSGASYVIYGGISVDGGDGIIDLSTLDGSNGFVINGIAEGDYSGASVSNAGDVNGDGYDDLIVGARSADSGSINSGASYVIYGGISVDGGDGIIDLSTLDGSNGYVIKGIAERDYSGTSVSNAGDVNSDGYDDLIVGGGWADTNNADSGESYIIYGGPTNPVPVLDYATLTILDDDLPIVTVNNFSANEADGSATFTLSIDQAPVTNITINVNITGYNTQYFHFLAGSTDPLIGTVYWHDDVVEEVGEEIILQLSGPNVEFTNSSVTLSLIDDDSPMLTLEDVAVNEATGIATFTVSIAQYPINDVTVDYTAPDGTTGTLTFLAGSRGSQTFTTSWLDDTILELSETQIATISNVTGVTIADGSGTLTILDDDGPLLTINDITANEIDSTATFTVSIDQAPTQDATLEYVATDGSTGTLTFVAGSTASKTITLNWLDDSIDEYHETIELSWLNISYAYTNATSATVTLINDDATNPLGSVLSATADDFTDLILIEAAIITPFDVYTNRGTMEVSGGDWTAVFDNSYDVGWGDAIINNEGDITASSLDYSNTIYWTTDYVFTLNNSGTITSSVTDDINGWNEAVLTGNPTTYIDNSGSIMSSGGCNFAVDDYSDSFTLVNSGSITSNFSANGYGTAVVVHNTISTDIFNGGIIDASSIDGDSANGLEIYSPSGTLNNTNTITASAYSYSIAAYIRSSNFDINNSGTMSGTSSFEYTWGMAVYTSTSITIDNSGFITADATGAHARGMEIWNSLTVSLTNSGTISASASDFSYGVQVANSSDVSIDNSGIITSSSAGLNYAGISVGSSDVLITNSGSIDTIETYNIYSGAFTLDIVNQSGGTIVANNNGNAISAHSEYTLTLTNQLGGTITGDIVGLGTNTIINAGVIDGNVSLGDNADYFESQGGTVTGFVNAGAGNDTLVSGSTNDIFTGGSGSDMFVFDDAFANDTITDFEDGVDLLDFSGSTLNFADLTVTQSGADTLIEDGSGNSITLIGETSTNITVDDFIF